MYGEPSKTFWAAGDSENGQEWRAAFCGASEVVASRLWATNFQSADASLQKGNRQLLHQAGPVILQ